MSLRLSLVAGRTAPIGATLAALLLTAAPARADVFLLKNDGQVRGELVNKDEAPRTTYQVRTPFGGLVTIAAEDVTRQVHQSALEVEYDRASVQVGDTVDEQWKMAEWCREKHLGKQRKTHLERIVELDPEHVAARRALGYSHIGGKWVTQAEQMTNEGRVKTEDGWRLPQEVEITENRRKLGLAEKDWFRKLKMYRGWLDSDKAASAREAIGAIDDPFATIPLRDNLNREPDRDVRQMYVDALARIGTPKAFSVLTSCALFDLDEEVRMNCLDHVARNKYAPAVGFFIDGLKNPLNPIVNRAAVGLGKMRDGAAIGPLIEALTTTHRFDIPNGNPGQITSTFGTGPTAGMGGGFSFGGGVTVIKEPMRNPSVLTALASLTSVNFEYDQVAWKYWYAQKKKPTTMDVRRD